MNVEILKNPERITLAIGTKDHEVVEMKGREGLSELFAFDCLCASAVEVRPRDLIGQPAVITFTSANEVHRQVSGMISSAANTESDDGEALLRVTVAPPVFRHTLGRDCRVFIDRNAPDIVREVLGDTMRTRWEIADDYAERDYTAQYREDDWTFAARLLEEEGIYYWFDDDDAGSILVFSDDSTGAAPISVPMIAYAEETGMLSQRDHVHELGAETQAGATKFTVASFNEQSPQLSVNGTQGTPGREHYDAPGGGPIESTVCQKRALVRLQCAEAKRSMVHGTATTMRFVPGKSAVIVGHPRLDNDYVVVGITHETAQRRRFGSDEDLGYKAIFHAIPKAVPYRHPEVTPVAKQAGLQSGRVVGPPGEEIHTDARGRVRAQMHWDRRGAWDDKAGKWLRVAQRGVSNSMLLPRQGWNVLMFMEEGATDAPTVLARVHDADHPPSYSLPDNKTKTVFKTATSPADGTSNEITFEDLAGAQEMFMNASRDMNYRVKEVLDDVVHNNQTRSIGGDQEINVGVERHEKIKSNMTMSVGGDETVKVGKGRTIGVVGTDSVTVGGNREIEAKSTMDIICIKQRKLDVSGNGTEEVSGNLATRCGKTEWKVGGSLKRTSELQLSEHTSEHHLDVGGSYTETCKDDIGLNVNLTYTETIAGNLSVQTEDRYTEGAAKKFKWKVVGNIDGRAPHVHVEAEKLIELAVGASTITIDEQSVTIMSPQYDLSDSPLMESDSAIIKQN